MRLMIQRAAQAAVTIDGAECREIGQGLVVLIGITEGDTQQDAAYLAEKCVGLRIFNDADGKMNRSVADIQGELLIISQFTLYGDCKKGKRPNFMRAAKPDTAIPLYEAFVSCCQASGIPVKTGTFGADMQVSLTNDGPVTIWMDTNEMR